MLSGATVVPNFLILLIGVAVLLLIAFLVALITDRNPLPFPDRDYHVFSVNSRPALVAFEQLMQRFGHNPRFRIDSDEVDRTVFSNGIIINHPHAQISATVGNPGGAVVSRKHVLKMGQKPPAWTPRSNSQAAPQSAGKRWRGST